MQVTSKNLYTLLTLYKIKCKYLVKINNCRYVLPAKNPPSQNVSLIFQVIPFLVCTSALLITTNAKAVEAPLDLISLEDLTPEDRKQLEILNHQASRSKRSGSGDILSHLKTAIAHGIARKVSQFAKSSASASAKFSSGSSGGSSGGHDSYDHHHVPEVCMYIHVACFALILFVASLLQMSELNLLLFLACSIYTTSAYPTFYYTILVQFIPIFVIIRYVLMK